MTSVSAETTVHKRPLDIPLFIPISSPRIRRRDRSSWPSRSCNPCTIRRGQIALSRVLPAVSASSEDSYRTFIRFTVGWQFVLFVP